MKRFQSRRGNGRFQRNTLENTMGLSVDVCPSCRRFNPRQVGQPAAENCHACGQPMKDPPPPACNLCQDTGTYYEDVAGDGGSRMAGACECPAGAGEVCPQCGASDDWAEKADPIGTFRLCRSCGFAK